MKLSISDKKILQNNQSESWNFDDALLNLYQLQSADELAKKDIPKNRLLQFKILNENFQKLNTKDEFLLQLKAFFKMLNKFSTGIL